MALHGSYTQSQPRTCMPSPQTGRLLPVNAFTIISGISVSGKWVAGRLTGRIRAIGLVAAHLAEGRIAKAERTMDLAGGHVQEAEGSPFRLRQAAPVAAHRLEQIAGTHHIGVDELARAVDGTIHMALGREIDDRAGPVLGEKAPGEIPVADVAPYEDMPWIVGGRREGFQTVQEGFRKPVIRTWGQRSTWRYSGQEQDCMKAGGGHGKTSMVAANLPASGDLQYDHVQG